MTKTTETWEERFDQAFLDVMYKDDGYTEERAVLKAFIRAELALARQEEAVAYGGCTNCYGKGYSTTKMYASGRHYTQEQNPYIPCKECDRGTQFAKAQERARQEGEKAGREKTLIQCAALAEYEGSFDSRAYENNKRDKFAQGAATASANIALKIKALTNPNH